MQAVPINFDRFNTLSDADAHARIRAARERLGERAVLLCHHYQRADVYQYADLTGDSLKLSRLAAETEAEFIVFCGVHFMAEVADIMSKPHQQAILPDLAAGCSMADMANLAKVERCWRELAEVLETPDALITPVTYINSAADLKAFCGEHGGIVCTSTNAPTILDWAFAQREKVLFFPDQHLGRWTGFKKGIPLEEMVVWDPDLEYGGLTAEQIRKARILLWKGHCSVHQRFTTQHIADFRAANPGAIVIVHPECSHEVCAAADQVGSTEFILKAVAAAPEGSVIGVGTEIHMVNRMANETPGKTISSIDPLVCPCSTMFRIDAPHLAWVLEELVAGRVPNRIVVDADDAEWARVALQRMLDIT